MQSRCHFDSEFKTRLVLDLLGGVQSQAEICRKHSLSPNLLESERGHSRFPGGRMRMDPSAIGPSGQAESPNHARSGDRKEGKWTSLISTVREGKEP